MGKIPRHIDASRRGKKGVKSSRSKKKDTNRRGEGGGENLPGHLGSELRLGGREKIRAKTMHGVGKNKTKQNK